MITTNMLIKENWTKILCWPKEGEKLTAHAKKWDQDIEDVLDEVGIQCFLIFNLDNDDHVFEGFAEEILCESYDWEVSAESFEDDEDCRFNNFDKFVKKDGVWSGSSVDLDRLVF